MEDKLCGSKGDVGTVEKIDVVDAEMSGEIRWSEDLKDQPENCQKTETEILMETETVEEYEVTSRILKNETRERRSLLV